MFKAGVKTTEPVTVLVNRAKDPTWGHIKDASGKVLHTGGVGYIVAICKAKFNKPAGVVNKQV